MVQEKPKKLRGVKAHVGLSREQIVAKAVEIIDRDGLQSLNMRGLGKEIGVDPMAIYRYIPSKKALFDAISDYLIAKVEIKTGSWETIWTSVAFSYRKLAHLHPEAFVLLALRPTMTDISAVVIEEMLGSLVKTGLTLSKTAICVQIFFSFLNGYLLAEVDPGPNMEHPSEEELQTRFQNLLKGKNYVYLPQFVTETYSATETFEETLEIVLDGIRQLIKKATL